MLKGSVEEQLIKFLAMSCILAVQSFELPSRTALTPRDIRERCCHNQWSMCCKSYPWEDEKKEEDDGSAVDLMDDLEGSGTEEMKNSSKPLTDKAYCRRFSTPFYRNYYLDKCINYFIIFVDVRLARNVIEELHRCVRRKDPEFLARLLKLEDELRPAGERCCSRREREGMLDGVYYAVRSKIQSDLADLDKKFERQIKNRRTPCYIHGHYLSIEDRMAERIKNMGYFVKCAELLECPRIPRRI